MHGRLPLLFAALFAASTAADTPLGTRVRDAASRLGDDDCETRVRAHEELESLGEEALPALRAAQDAAEDPEVKGRLRQIIRRIEPLPWHTSLEDAQEESRRLGRPLFVLAADGPEARGSTEEGTAFRRRTLADPDLRELLCGTFTLCWVDAGRGEAAGPPPGGDGVKPGGQPDRIRMWFCTPEGEVRHLLSGWWPADRVRLEAARALPLIEIASAERAKSERTAMARAWRQADVLKLVEAIEEKDTKREDRQAMIEVYRLVQGDYERGAVEFGMAVGDALRNAGLR